MNIPEIHDAASAASAWEGLLAARQGIEDAMLIGSVFFVADIWSRHPALDTIGFLLDTTRFQGAGSREPTRFHACVPDPSQPSYFMELSLASAQALRNIPAQLASQLAMADDEFQRLAGDPRLEPFYLAAMGQHNGPQDELFISATKDDDIGDLASPDASRKLAHALFDLLGRPELWAKVEAAQLRAATPPGNKGAGPVRA